MCKFGTHTSAVSPSLADFDGHLRGVFLGRSDISRSLHSRLPFAEPGKDLRNSCLRTCRSGISRVVTRHSETREPEPLAGLSKPGPLSGNPLGRWGS